jgi:hypothetical protein
MNKPILSLDFDGVLHSYTSGWKGADVIPDPPVEGAMQFILDAMKEFSVCVFSSRSNQFGGIDAMERYIAESIRHQLGYGEEAAKAIVESIQFPTEKPPAFVTIDDRAITFTGTWPDIETLKAFKPWNKR